MVIVAAALVGGRLLSTSSDHASNRAPAARPRDVVPSLAPPGPIPGYLLIADRGNNRMLLVDTRGRIRLALSASGQTPAMPFRFDDDTFFGPGRPTASSRTRKTRTRFRSSRSRGDAMLWRYGHVNLRRVAPGYLNTPDDAYLLAERARLGR